MFGKMKRTFTIAICIMFLLGNTYIYEPFMQNGHMVFADEIPIDNEAPSPPEDLSYSSKTDSSVVLSWSASTDNVGVTLYRIYNGESVAEEVDGTTGTVQGLTPLTTYNFTVKALDAAGNISAASDAISVTTNEADDVSITEITVDAISTGYITTIEPINLALGKTYTKSEQPDQQFADNNESESTDGILAGDYSDGNSYGYRVQENTTKTVDVVVDLGALFSASDVKIHKWEGSQQYGADTIQIYGSQNGANYELITGLDTSDSTWTSLSFEAIQIRYLKVEFSKTNTGAWGNDWMFIDEIQVLGHTPLNTGQPNIPVGISMVPDTTEITINWDRLIDNVSGLVMTNLLGDKGSISKNETDYETGYYPASWPDTTNPLVVWTGGLVREVDGYKCLDGYFSDFAWPDWPRASYVHMPTIEGHKYVVHSMVEGNITMEQIDGSTGQALGSTAVSGATSWTPAVYTAAGDGSELIVAFRGGYVTSDIGYFRDVVVVDVTELGDGSLTDTELKNKYSSLKYFEGTQGNPAGTEYDIEVDGTVIDNGTSTSYTHTGLTPDTEHTYRIRAKNAYGVSEWSEPATVSTITTIEPINLALGKTYTKSEQPDQQFADNNESESTDGILAGDYSDGNSYGYRVQENTTKTVDVVVDLGALFSASDVKIHKWEGSQQYGADTIRIYGSQNGANYELITGLDTSDSTWTSLSFEAIQIRYLKVEFSKTNTGAWGNDWMFIDEIQVLGHTPLNTGQPNIPVGISMVPDTTEITINWDRLIDNGSGLVMTNLLGDKGSISKNETDYETGYSPASWPDTTNPLVVWTGGLVREVDGYKCLDGSFGDFAWPDWPRASYVHVPTIEGHKYVVHSMVEGNITMEQIDGSTGQALGSTAVSGAISWTPAVYTATGDGSELIVAFRGGYVTSDMGYFRDVVVVDVTELGDGSLTDTELKNKYSSLKYFEGTQGNSEGTEYDIEVDGTVIDNGTSTSYTHTGLTPDTEHTYRIRAKNAYGVSEWSEPVTVSTITTIEPINLALGKTYTKSEQPDQQFADNNESESTDGILAGDYSDGNSYGYRVQENTTKTVDVVVNLGALFSASDVKIHKWEGSQQYGADTIRIYGSQNGANYELITGLDTSDSTWTSLSFEAIQIRYLKVEFSKTNTGAWGNDWMFIDEIQVLGHTPLNTGQPNIPVGISMVPDTTEITINWDRLIDNGSGLVMTNLLGEKGSISKNETDYETGYSPASWPDTTNPLVVWTDGLVREVDGYKCLDGSFGDFAWPDWPRASYVHMPTIEGHKYVVHSMVEGNITMEQIDGSTGQALGSTAVSGATSWTPAVYTATGDGSELIVAFRGGYVTSDIGYFRDVVVVDVTELGDGSLTDTELKNKYSSLKYFEGTQGNPEGTEYDIEVDGTVIDNGTSTSYTHTGLTSDTEHTYRIRAKNAYGVSEWSEPVTARTLLTSVSFTLLTISGNTYDVPLKINNTSDFEGSTFTITYDMSALELVDLCDMTKSKEIATGVIDGTGITITNISDGTIDMTIDQTIPEGKKWSGIINIFKFRAKTTGETLVTADFN